MENWVFKLTLLILGRTVVSIEVTIPSRKAIIIVTNTGTALT